jgi:hypothetical protein
VQYINNKMVHKPLTMIFHLSTSRIDIDHSCLPAESLSKQFKFHTQPSCAPFEMMKYFKLPVKDSEDWFRILSTVTIPVFKFRIKMFFSWQWVTKTNKSYSDYIIRNAVTPYGFICLDHTIRYQSKGWNKRK